MPFSFFSGELPGLIIIEPRVFPDDRGFFLETFKESDFTPAGISGPFVQDNHSRSSRGVLRGLHFQKEPHAQGKLVRVSRGVAWDVAVDLRNSSPAYGKWTALELSEDNQRMVYIPPGFAHGFLALEDDTELQYKCTAEYKGDADAGVRWDDPDIAIDWPFTDVIVSEKDMSLPYLKDLA
ncbi:dTDP-4-dehydrorhamnose 3,5-epimerase [Marispirochaeta aestuarii]|uniref:dTDP-4-dehydrorhamnose 3,5-epimerase n=1 Tax=Marispirochaeta aestuarii TaxID=1963862 RepID=A0A1Y1RWN4_9SPIO|nr:dTDP-4-dehydrorhamnose 3,5-epimerase [Marispirochaeta aestuarii]ORC34626.1 dTDP-4-dehydrorhamnose 3,5-epimerase [Marispirochaeta aestuarii]